MRKSIEQSIKRWLKRRIRITFGVIVAFLLGSIGTYGADILIGWDSGTDKIKVELDGESIVDGKKVKVDGNKIIFSEDFSHNGQITFDGSVLDKGISIENSGTINSSTPNANSVRNENLGNGIRVFSYSDSSTTATSKFSIDILKNGGIISGNVSNIGNSSYYSNLGNGIGIFSYSATNETLIDTLKNGGIISGNVGDIGNNSANNNLGNGVGIFSNSVTNKTLIDTLKNEGIISGNAGDIGNYSNYNTTGNGVSVFSYSKSDTGTSTTNKFSIATFENEGVILGRTEEINNRDYNNTGNGVGVFSYSYSDAYNLPSLTAKSEASIDNSFRNKGVILGNAEKIDESSSRNSTGNGVGLFSYSYSKIDLANNCSSNATSEASIENFTNSGIVIGGVEEISDTSNSIGNGIGLFSYSDSFAYSSALIPNEISSATSKTSIDKLENEGIITGTAKKLNNSEYNNTGNGIGAFSYSTSSSDNPTATSEALICTLTNKGVILGNTKNISDTSNNSIGNGVGIFSFSNSNSVTSNALIGTLKNGGVISGYVGNIGNNSDNNNAGNGIGVYSNNGTAQIENFTNAGVIAGKNSGVSVKTNIGPGTITNYVNYGIVAGKTPVVAKDSQNKEFDESMSAGYGLAITLNDTGAIETITAGKGKEASSNPTVDDYSTWAVVNTDFKGNTNTLMNDGKNSFTIINGALVGINVNNQAEFSNSIINSLGEAIVFSGSGNSFKGTDVIINGGGLRKGANDWNIAVKAYEKEGSKFELAGKSIVNGDISMKGESNEIVLNGRDIILNGDIEMDPLSSSSITFANDSNSTNDTLAISSEIYGAGTININENVTFFEQVTREVDDGQGNIQTERVTGADIEGVGKINIGANGVMNIRLGEAENNIVTNHALNTSTSTLTTDTTVNISDNGQLKFVLNGNGAGTIIDLGSTKLGDSVKDGTETKNPNLEATSKYHTVIKDKDNLNNLIVEVASKLPPIVDPPVDPPVNPDPKPEAPNFADYQYLNKIYQSITSSKQDGILTDVDSDEKYIQSLQFFSDIFGANPYGYSAEISRRTMEMQERVVLRKDLNPELHKWAIYGGLTHIDGGSEERFYGKGVKTLDVGSRDIEADSKITGGYMLAEYKYSDSLVLGTTLGGSSSDTDILHSKVEGDAVYLGAYAKKYSGNLRTTLGVGVHYGDYEADRVGVRYWNGTKDSYSENYNDLGLSIYGDIRYSLPLEKGFFLEPHITLSYTHIEQDGVDEGGKELAIETDDKEFNYTNLRTGVDLKKVITRERAKHTVAVGVAYDRLLDGYDEEYITGRMKGGSGFDILTTRGEKHSLSVNGKYEVEFENGVTFDIAGEYSFERDTHHSGSRSTSKGEWTVGGGIGYRF